MSPEQKALDPKALKAAKRAMYGAGASTTKGLSAALRAYLAADPEHAALHSDMERLHDSLNSETAARLAAESRVAWRPGSPPEPVAHPSKEWCDLYAQWYYSE